MNSRDRARTRQLAAFALVEAATDSLREPAEAVDRARQHFDAESVGRQVRLGAIDLVGEQMQDQRDRHIQAFRHQ